MARTRLDSATRRGQIIAAARTLFFERGVDGTPIEDITRAAGVAHGTFYLYFKTKDDVVNAVMDEMAREMVARLLVTASTPDVPATDKLVILREALVGLQAVSEPDAVDLVTHYHGPEHRDVHDRLAHEVNRQLVPVIASIIAQGVAEGTFDVADPMAAAAFALSAAEGLDLLENGTDPATEARVDALMAFVLRGLGVCDD